MHFPQLAPSSLVHVMIRWPITALPIGLALWWIFTSSPFDTDLYGTDTAATDSIAAIQAPPSAWYLGSIGQTGASKTDSLQYTMIPSHAATVNITATSDPNIVIPSLDPKNPAQKTAAK